MNFLSLDKFVKRATILTLESTILASAAIAMPPMSRANEDRLVRNLVAHPPMITQARLPKGAKIGKCLLVVGGRIRISGTCAYTIAKGGAFHIGGPRQIYDGIDYPTANFGYEQVSTDYWADVFKDDQGHWTGYGNSDVRSTHGDGDWGTLQRAGGCYASDQVRVCLWR